MEFIYEYFDCVPSTNDIAKKEAASGACEGTVIIAESQTGGKGRAGHKFYSPSGGIYMSLILRPRFSDFTLITPAASVAVCSALDSLGFECSIKWVNDVYKDDKKVCGILTESDVLSGWAVLGIGINTTDPGSGSPDIAGYLFEGKADNGMIIKKVLSEFSKIYEDLPDKTFIGYYRERSFLQNKDLIINGKEYKYKGIDDDFGLIVYNGEGVRKFISGEVSVKFK